MNSRKAKVNNILIVVVAAAILIYVFVQVYSATHVKMKTETAQLSTTYQSINTTALAVRDEHVLDSPSGGVTVPCVEDGGKVNAGGNVAMTFENEKQAVGYSQYSQIQQKIDYYEKLETRSISQTSSVESINSEVDTELNDYIRAIDNVDTQGVQTAGENINDSLLRRQMLIGEKVDLMSVIQELNKELEQYSSYSSPQDYVSSKESGVFSSYVDGYENVIPYENAQNATVNDIENALKETKNQKGESKHLGKLITSYIWYFECVLDVNDIKGLKDGQKVTIALKNSDDTTFEGQIVSGTKLVPGQTKTALIIKCNDMSENLTSLRREDIEIRIRSYEGIKLPASALHKKGNKKGVYALISSKVVFRETEVIYSDDDWVIVKFDPDNKDGIRLYDQIITQGKELEDGKVYT